MTSGPTTDDVLGVVDGEEAVLLTQEIVRVPSVVGDEEQLSVMLAGRMRGMGYDEVYRQEALPGRHNVIGVVDSGRPGPTMVLTGHIDTKPVCVGWEDDPYSGRIEDGRLHGHAVMDMKAGIGGIVAAGAALARCRDRWAGKVLVVCVVDHMGDQIGAIRFFEEHAADLCILAELTDLDIYLGHRGRLYWDITAYGRAAHTCHRHEAVNAIARMAPLIGEIEALRLTPEVPDWVAELVGEELYTAVGPDLRRPAARRSVDDPRRVHDPGGLTPASRDGRGAGARGARDGDREGRGAAARHPLRDGARRPQGLLPDRSRSSPGAGARRLRPRGDRGDPAVRGGLLAGRYRELRQARPDGDLRAGT